MTLPDSLKMPDGKKYLLRVAAQPALDTLCGDEELAEFHFQSRTSPLNKWTKPYKCTPSVFRFYPLPRESAGDFRVDISPMLDAYLVLNGEDSVDDPKTRYLFNPGTALFNDKGYPMQAYLSMSGNIFKGLVSGEWFKFETLTPSSNVAGMTHATHPWFVHRFDLVCWRKDGNGDWQTQHHPNTPPGIIDYFLVTKEGFAYIPKRYVKAVELEAV